MDTNRMQPIYDNQESFESALDKAWKSYNESGARTVDSCEDNYTECAYAKGFREGYLFGHEKQKEQKPHYTKRNALFDECVKNCDPDVMKKVSDEVDKLLQKEQQPSSRFLPGDWVVYDGPLGHAILQVDDVLDGRYTFVDNDSTLLVEDSDKFLRPLTPKDVEGKQKPSAEYVLTKAGLKPYKDGNQWCILAGDNLQEGICGFGDTIEDALYEFLIDALNTQKEQKPLTTEETELNSIAFLEQMGYTCIPSGKEQKLAEWMTKQVVKAHCVESANPASENPETRLHLITLLYKENEDIPYVQGGDDIDIIIRKK